MYKIRIFNQNCILITLSMIQIFIQEWSLINKGKEYSKIYRETVRQYDRANKHHQMQITVAMLMMLQNLLKGI